MSLLWNSGQTTISLLSYKEATKNFENLQENACAEVTFFHNKVTSWKPATLSKKD